MNWLAKLFSSKASSKNVAKDRLKLVLMHDRANCSTELLEMIKNDIIMVLNKYVDIDHSELDIQVSQTSNDNGAPAPVLYANIPIKNMRKHRA